MTVTLKRTWPAGVAAICTGVLGIAPAAFAQDGSAADIGHAKTEIPEIVVTAQRRAENIQTVPIAVQAFSEEELKAAGVANLKDLSTIAPSMQYNDSSSLQLSLRGVGTQGVGPGIESPIALYVDNVYYAAMSASALNLNNVAAVEVINGPQGTLFGRNATGGLVHVRTKDPVAEFGGNTSVGYGNYNTATGSLYLTGGLSENVLADIAVQGQHQGEGYGKNIRTGEDMDGDNHFGVRSKWVLTPADDLKIKLIGDYSWSNIPLGTYNVPGTIAAGGSVELPPHDTDSPYNPGAIVKQGGLSGSLDFNLGSVTLTNIAAWRRTKFDYRGASTTSNPDYVSGVDIGETHSQLSEELQLSSTGTSALTWTVGGYYFWEDARWDPANPYSAVNGGFFGFGPDEIQIFIKNITKSVAGYGQASYEFSPGTKLTVGLRYTHETHDYDNYMTIDGTPFGYLTPDSAFFHPGGPRFHGEIGSNKLTWRLGLSHEFSGDAMLYASYNRGFRSGSFQSPSVNPDQPLRPETLDAFEVGLKSRSFDRALTFNAAAFYYDYMNMQVNAYFGSFPSFINGARAHLYGLDGTAVANLSSQFKMAASLSLLHSKFVDFPDSYAYIPRTTFPYGNIMTTIDASGNELPHAPHLTFNISPSYRVPMVGGNLDLVASLSYNSGWWGESENRQRQNRYAVLNLGATWKSDHGYSVAVWGKNVTDKTYKSFLISNASHDMTTYAPPATYGVTLSKEF